MSGAGHDIILFVFGDTGQVQSLCFKSSDIFITLAVYDKQRNIQLFKHCVRIDGNRWR